MSLLALTAGSVLAVAGREPRTLTLPEAIRLATAHSTSVQVATSAYKAAKARVGEQNSQELPHLSLSGGATRYDDKTTVNLPGAGSFQVLPDHQEQLGVVLAQVLDVSGQISAEIAQARLEELAAQYETQSAVQDEALETTIAYYNVLRAKQSLRVANAALADYREQLKTTTRLHDGGVGQKIDVFRAESQEKDAEREVTTRANELDAALSTLNDLIGSPLDQPEALVDDAPQTIEAGSLEATDRSKLIAVALDKRSESLAAKLQVSAAKKGIRIAAASMGPSLSLALSEFHYPSTSFEQPRENVGALTLSVSIPLFDGGLARSQISEARSNVALAKTREEQTHRQIALQVQNAALDAATARKRLESATVALKAAEQARSLAQQRYENQVALYLEVTDAESALTSSQASVVDATYDLLMAQARLRRAISQPLD
jgi:outer membrane protein TolC